MKSAFSASIFSVTLVALALSALAQAGNIQVKALECRVGGIMPAIGAVDLKLDSETGLYTFNLSDRVVDQKRNLVQIIGLRCEFTQNVPQIEFSCRPTTETRKTQDIPGFVEQTLVTLEGKVSEEHIAVIRGYENSRFNTTFSVAEVVCTIK